MENWIALTAGFVLAATLLTGAWEVMIVADAERLLGRKPVGAIALSLFLGLWFFAAATRSLGYSMSLPVFAALFLGPILFSLVLLALPYWRGVVASASTSGLIAVQCLRAIGGVFLIALANQAVSREFAVPAGWGDIATGVLALPVAWAVIRRVPGWRLYVTAFSLFGLGDLINAVGVGSGLLQPISAQIFGTSEVAQGNALGLFPLALIPTFLVPQAIILHLMVFTKLTVPGWAEPASQSTKNRKTR